MQQEPKGGCKLQVFAIFAKTNVLCTLRIVFVIGIVCGLPTRYVPVHVR